ncbi:MAG: hypothetical protein V1696_04140 [Candidatus Jorgensenbacteria bacterium]
MKLTFLKSGDSCVAWVDDQRVLARESIPTLISELARTILEAKQDDEKIVVECPLSYDGKNHPPFSEVEQRELKVHLDCFGIALPT